jgi:hypothetical protein
VQSGRVHAWLACAPLAVLAVFLLALAGCGAPASHANTVRVTLSDFKIASSQTTFQAGTIYHFVVTNAPTSTTNHEFMIMRPMALPARRQHPSPRRDTKLQLRLPAGGTPRSTRIRLPRGEPLSAGYA